MNELPAKNEGFRILEEAVYFVGPSDAGSAGRAVPVGLGVAEATSKHGPDDFQHWHTDKLRDFVERLGATLPPSDLCHIHDIALRRLAERQGVDDDARSLSQLVMKVAANRLSS